MANDKRKTNRKSNCKGKGRTNRRNQVKGGTSTNRQMLQRGPFKKYNSVDPFPPGQFVKFTYSQSVLLQAGTSGIYGTQHRFRLNDIYDPDESGVGHQPYGHDQMALIYKRFKVVGAEVTIDWMNPDQDGLMCGAMIINPDDTFSTTSKSLDVLNEKPMGFSVNLNDSGKQRYTMRQYLPMHQLLGITKGQFENQLGDDYSSTFGTSPTKCPKLIVNAGSVAGVSGAAITARVTIVYYTQVSHRLALTQS